MPGDYLLICFGGNDQKNNTDRGTPIAEYQEYFRTIIEMALAKGAHPIVVSPSARANLWNDETASDTVYAPLQDYRDAGKAVADEYGIPYIPFGEKMKEMYSNFESDGYSTNIRNFLFLHTTPDDVRFVDNENYATSKYNNEEDSSHFNVLGSYWFTNNIASYLKDIDGTLGAFIDSNKVLTMDELVDEIETEYEQWLVDMENI